MSTDFMAQFVLEIRLQIEQYGYTNHEFTTTRKLICFDKHDAEEEPRMYIV